MAHKWKFAIPSFLAAGLTPFAAVSGEGGPEAIEVEGSLFDNLKKIVSNIDESQKFTLAQHRSHQSHGSHESHQSHRSSSYRVAPEDGTVAVAYGPISSRNRSSTPSTSILPSTPAITKKLKILPGNSAKFRKVVSRVQLALIMRGYEAGELNGELHARTVAALYRYQVDSRLVPSGKVTSEVLSSLGIVAQ